MGLATTHSPRLLLLIFVTALIDMIGFGIIIPILPFFAERYGADAFTAGLLTAVFLIVQFVFAPLWGNLSDRIGRRPVLLVCIFATSVSYVVFGMAESLLVLFIARALGGLFAGKYSTIQAYIADITTSENRSRGMGLFGAAFGMGFILGPVAGGILGQWGFALPLFFAAGMTALNGVAAVFFLPESIGPELRKKIQLERKVARLNWDRLVTILTDVRIGHPIALTLIFNAAFSMLYATFALYSEREFGFHTAETGYLFAYIGVVGAIIQGGLIGLLVTRYGEAALIKIGFVLTAIGMFLLSVSGSFVQLIAGSTLMAGGSGLLSPALSGLVSRRTVESQQGQVLGVMQSAANLGRMGGMITGGYVFTAVSIWSPFWLSGILLSLASLYSVFSLRQMALTDHLNFAGETHE